MFRHHVIPLLLAASVLACTAIAGPPQSAPAPTDIPYPRASPTPAPIPPPLIPPSPAPTVPPTPDIALPPGLMLVLGSLEDERALWIVDRAGEPKRSVDVFADPRSFADFDVSPDGKQVLYVISGDVWLLDTATGQTQNLTRTPDRRESMPRWWPGHPGNLVCGSLDAQSYQSFGGALTLVGLDGTYRILDEDGIASPPAPRPNGDVILYVTYDFDETGRMINVRSYAPDEGHHPLSSVDMGMAKFAAVTPSAGTPFYGVGSLSWSPDGRTLGLAVLGTFDNVTKAGIMTIDWTNRNTTIIKTYSPDRPEEPLFHNAPKFSPHDDWLLFQEWDDGVDNNRFFLSDVSGVRDLTGDVTIREQLGPYPAISPDGQWVAIMSAGRLGLINTTDWSLHILSLPEEVTGVGWATPPD